MEGNPAVRSATVPLVLQTFSHFIIDKVCKSVYVLLVSSLHGQNIEHKYSTVCVPLGTLRSKHSYICLYFPHIKD